MQGDQLEILLSVCLEGHGRLAVELNMPPS